MEQRLRAILDDLTGPKGQACDPAYRASVVDLVTQALSQWRDGSELMRKASLRASAAAKLTKDEREALGL